MQEGTSPGGTLPQTPPGVASAATRPTITRCGRPGTAFNFNAGATASVASSYRLSRTLSTGNRTGRRSGPCIDSSTGTEGGLDLERLPNPGYTACPSVIGLLRLPFKAPEPGSSPAPLQILIGLRAATRNVVSPAAALLEKVGPAISFSTWNSQSQRDSCGNSQRGYPARLPG